MAPIRKSTALDGYSIDVIRVDQNEISYRIIGDTPLIMERFSTKAQRALLAPKGRMTTVEKEQNEKHNPREEYTEAAYVVPDGPTRLAMPSTSFKAALLAAALRTPGAKKTEIGAMTYIVGEWAPIWGIPRLLMSGVRSADIGKTPDIRTRPIITPWATKLTIKYVVPNLTPNTISNLLAGAGILCGVGGWRQGKGSGNYGLFHPIQEEDDAEFGAIVASGGREVQLEALRVPVAYDEETADLLAWHDEEMERRRLRGSPSSVKKIAALAAD